MFYNVIMLFTLLLNSGKSIVIAINLGSQVTMFCPEFDKTISNDSIDFKRGLNICFNNAYITHISGILYIIKTKNLPHLTCDNEYVTFHH